MTAENSSQPRWSVMVPVWKRVDYLEAALLSVLAQDPGPTQMEICVMDDPSDTDVESAVRRIAGDRVTYHRHSTRQGMVGNWNSCVRHARGVWVHLLHDDDLALPGFYKSVENAETAHPEIRAFFSRCAIVDQRGVWTGLSPLHSEAAGVWKSAMTILGEQNPVRFPGIAVHRSAYEELVGFRAEAGYVADWDMWRRIAFRYPVYFTPEVLAGYRVHPGSETRRTHHDAGDLIQAFVQRTFVIEDARTAVPAEVSDLAIRHYLRVLADKLSDTLVTRGVGAAMQLFRAAPKFGRPAVPAALGAAYLFQRLTTRMRHATSSLYIGKGSA